MCDILGEGKNRFERGGDGWRKNERWFFLGNFWRIIVSH
jgi:hypothetical protein